MIAIAPDGTVVYTTTDLLSTPEAKIFGFSADLSAVRFEYVSPFPYHVPTPALIGADGTIYFSVSDPRVNPVTKVVALSPDGTLKSEFKLNDVQALTPGVLTADGTLLFGFGCCPGSIVKLYAFK